MNVGLNGNRKKVENPNPSGFRRSKTGATGKNLESGKGVRKTCNLQGKRGTSSVPSSTVSLARSRLFKERTIEKRKPISHGSKGDLFSLTWRWRKRYREYRIS